MNRVLVVLFLFIGISTYAQQQTTSIGFIENKGQIVDQKGKPNKAVKYLLNTNGLNVQLRKNGFSYDVYETKKHPLNKRQIEKQRSFGSKREDSLRNPNYTLEYIYHRIDIDFVNSNPNVQLISEGKSTDYDNYYNVPSAPDGILEVHKFQRITYQNIYPNIDVVFFIPEDKSKPVEYNFIVKPGGKIADIQLKFNGTKTELVDNKIKMNVRFGQMEETLPLSWTENDKKEVAINYKKIKNNVYGFETSENLIGKKVVIDPVPNRLWGTYYGGDSYEQAYSVEYDLNNNICISGITQSKTNIATSGAFQKKLIGFINFFIAKIDTNGNRIWGTYFEHIATGWYFSEIQMKTDSKNNLYFTGEEDETTKMATPGSFQSIKNSGKDVILVKLNSQGAREWATYYGGNGIDYVKSICIDNSDNVYIAGLTYSTDVMSSLGAYQINNNSKTGAQDAFIAKFNSNGNRLWGTFYGGLNNDSFTYIDISNDGYLYAVGTQNSNYQLTAPYQGTINNTNVNGIIVKFDLNGNRIWENLVCLTSTILNSKLKNDSLFITGETWNQTSIATSGTYFQNYQPNNTGQGNGLQFNKSNSFIINFNIKTQQKIWGSYFTEEIQSVDVNQNNEIYIAGSTAVSGITTSNAYRPFLCNTKKCYILKLNSLGQRMWGTYYGGEWLEHAGFIRVDDQKNIVLYGDTSSSTGIATPNTHQVSLSGGSDTFLAKFKDDETTDAPHVASNSPICIGFTLKLSASGGSSYSWSGPNGFTSSQKNPTIPNATVLNSGTYSCKISGTKTCAYTATIDVLVGDNIKPTPDITSLPNIIINCPTAASISIPTATDTCTGKINGTTTDPLSYSLSGNYTITWNYNDGNGNIETQTQNVVISDVSLPILNSPQSFCIQQDATINDIQITGQNIKWYDSQTGGNLVTGTTLLQDGVTYYASQTPADCESARVPVTVHIQNTAAPTGNNQQTLCASQNPTLNDISTNGTDIKWYDLSNSTTPLPSTTFLVDGATYYATQTVNGCESVNRLAVSVSLITSLNAQDYSGFICDEENNGSENVDLSDFNFSLLSSSGNIFTYYASLNGAENEIPSEQFNSNYDLNSDLNTIYVRIESDNGCHQIVRLVLTLVNEPTIAIPDNVIMCEYKKITVNAGNGFDTYLWSTNQNKPSIAITQPGNYSVTVTKNYGTSSCATTKNFTVSPSNPATITSVETEDWTDNQNKITVNTTGLGDYEFSLDGINYQDSNIFTGLVSGNYSVSVRDKNNCGTTTKSPIYLLIYPKFFTPNNDGFHDNWYVKFSQFEENFEVQIYDRYGKLMKSMPNTESWDGTFNGKLMPSDDYWFFVTRNDGQIYKGHFTLKR